MQKNLKMCEFPESERPRERLEKKGPQVLTDAELLAVILKTGTNGENVLSLARRILALPHDGNISGLCDISEEQLLSVKGIGKAKATQIMAACELATRISRDRSEEFRTAVRSADDLGKILTDRQKWYNKEVFEIVLLDTRNQIIRISQVSVGTLDQSLVHPREVFEEAVRSYCASIVLCHNHPSGDPTPSSDDIRTTERLIQAGVIMGIEITDHIITGKDSFYSMYKQGDLARLKKRKTIFDK